MEYNGKLYGKIGRKHFDTGVTSRDFDKLSQEHKQMLTLLKEIFKNTDPHSQSKIWNEINELIKILSTCNKN